ncbi:MULTISPECIES: NfeD family protein [unclassified Streptomyces]|uniref:NfeD family protein n=1 Tax=unclassified Streptomyces TaxID=2593676 RepID=UPI003251C41A
MTLLLGLGIAGIVLLVVSLIFDGIFEGLLGGALSGFFDGLLSLPVIAGFLSMLGFGGAIVLGTTGLGTVAAIAAGVLAGIVAAWLTWKFSKALMRDQTDATPRGDDLVGTSGTVVTAIPADGYGEVLLRLGGQPVKLAAKSPMPVERGTEIWVEAALSTTSVVVRPVER